MSTLPDFTGPGFFAGEAPDGLTTIAGTPTSAQVRVYWRDPADPDAPDVLVSSTQSAVDGTWQIAGLNPALRYVVRAQKNNFDDVTVVGAQPSRTDVIAYVDSLEPTEAFNGLTGHVLLDSGLTPFTASVIEPLPYGLEPVLDGRKLLIVGTSDDVGQWESVVRVTAGNGVFVDVPVAVEIVSYRDPLWADVVALLHFDGDLADATGKNAWNFQGGAGSFESKPSMFNQALGLNAAASVFSTSSDIRSLGNQAVTFECRFRVESSTMSLMTLFNIGLNDNDSGGRRFMVMLSKSGDGYRVSVRGGTGTGGGRTAISYFTATPIFEVGQTYHLALTASAAVSGERNFSLYMDGVLVHTMLGAQCNSWTDSRVTLGRGYWGGIMRFLGWIDEFRVTSAIRYTEDFTPPDKPFPNQ